MQLNLIDQTDAHKFRLGHICTLTVLRLVSIGAYLEWDNEDGVLLPKKYLPEGVHPGDKVNVFIYHDNDGRLIATTLQPYAEVGQVALLDCVSVTGLGAFLDWGIHKDVFVPFSEQQDKMLVGHSYVVFLYVDHVSGKIVASAKLSKHLGNSLPSYSAGAKVKAIVVGRNDVGYRVVVDHQHWGLVYFDSVQGSLYKGESITAYVIRTREDGKLDLSLRPVGYDRAQGDGDHLMELLQQRGGHLPVGDKSSSEEIYNLTGLSKKSFKMAVGKLYKERKITITPNSITSN